MCSGGSSGGQINHTDTANRSHSDGSSAVA
eukprot:COSAG06_NODE_45731_length_352_cov_1.027668_2_plen_29_part_01